MAPNDIALSYELTPHEIAEQLILNGFSPCPLEPMSKAIKIKDWTSKEFSPDQFKQTNGVGIKTGNGLVAIDIDVYDPKISAEITQAAFQELGPTFARVGQAPKIALLYRSTAINSKITLPVQPTGEAPTKKTEAIEVLASGQQLVAAAIHPDTKRPYSWDGTTPWSPFTGHIENLPLIDAANWQNFHSSISHFLVQESLTQHAAVKQSGTQNRSIGNDSPSVEEVQEILSYIPSTLDYNTWVIVTMGLKSLGEQYRTLWLNWSATGQNHDPSVDPAKWDQVAQDGKATFKTVCHYAQQNGADLSAIARLHSNLNTGPNIVRSKVSETPTPLVRKFPPAGRYPIEALGPLEHIVTAVHRFTQAPVAICAASALSTASLVLQGFADVQSLAGPKPLSLYVLTVAKSGERKSTCDGPFISGIREFEKEQALGSEIAFQKHLNDHAIWSTLRNGIMAKLKKPTKAISRQEAEQKLELLGPEPNVPPSTDRIASEPTYEGLTRMFKEGQPALGIFSDEGGQFLGGYGMNSDNKQKTLAALNDLWGGNPIRRTRQGDGSYTLHNRRLAAHLMVQPTVAHALLADPLAVDTGFLARFLIAQPESTIGTREYAKSVFDKKCILAFEICQKNILNNPLPVDEKTNELQLRRLGLSTEAESVLITFADEVELLQAKGGDYEGITGTASKSAEQAARLAGVLTLWKDFHGVSVERTEMEQAIELARFYLNEAKRLVDIAIVSRELQMAEELRKWIIKNNKDGYLLLSDIIQNGPNNIRDKSTASKLVKIIEDAGWLKKVPNGITIRGKARSTAYQLAELAEA